MGTRLLALSFVLLVGCGAEQQQDRGAPPVPEPEGDASCESVCAHLDELGCKQFDPPPVPDNDPTCIEFCTGTMEGGYDLHLGCVIRVKKCEQVDPASTGEWCG